MFAPELTIFGLSGRFGGIVLSARLAFCVCTARVFNPILWVVQMQGAGCAGGKRD